RLDPQPLSAEPDLIERPRHQLARHPEVEQRTEEHIACAPRRAVDMQVLAPKQAWVRQLAHERLRLIRAAATAAPNPLSMLTTMTPGEHDDSIEIIAAKPPNPAP